MGEIAKMMLDGFMDEETGEIIDWTAPGYPRRMSDRFATGGTHPRTPAEQAARTAKNKARKARQKRNKAAKAAALAPST